MPSTFTPRRVLAIGSHPDDIELGCGGALLAHRAAGDNITMLVLTGGDRGPVSSTERDQRRQEQEAAAQMLGARLLWGGLKDCTLSHNQELISVIEGVIHEIQPDVIYVHATDDSHQDHIAAARGTLSAARHRSTILHYMSPSTLTFQPNLYVDITDHIDGKLAMLSCHHSQVSDSSMVNLQAKEASSLSWGFQSRRKNAEPFMTTRFVWDIARGGSTETSSNAADAASDDLTAGLERLTTSQLADAR